MKIKNLFIGFACILTLTACQGNSIDVDEENNKETGVSAADFYEYELHEYLSWGDHVPAGEFGLPIIGYIDEEKTESDSEILILHWTGLHSGVKIDEKFIDGILNDNVELAKIVKINLVENGYGQDVYIKVYNDNKLVGIVSSDGEIIKL